MEIIETGAQRQKSKGKAMEKVCMQKTETENWQNHDVQ